jgi:hypothetical protein
MIELSGIDGSFFLSAEAAITSLPGESWEFADIGDPEGH